MPSPEEFAAVQRKERQRSKDERRKASVFCCRSSYQRGQVTAAADAPTRSARAPVPAPALSPATTATKKKKKKSLVQRLSKRLSMNRLAMDGIGEGAVVDCLIVGGGFAGAYTALRLGERYPNKSIVLMERSEEFGGRLYSDDNDEDNDTNKDELGGMRVFPSVHPKVKALVEEVGCDLVPVKLSDENNLFYRHSIKERVRKGDVLIHGREPSALVDACWAAYAKAMPEDAELPPYESEELRKMSLPAFMLKYGAKQAEIDEYFTYSGYDIFSDTEVAASIFFEDGALYDSALDDDQRYVRQGFQQVILNMVDKCSAKVDKLCEVVAIEEDSYGVHTVRYKDGASENGGHALEHGHWKDCTLRARVVVLAMAHDEVVELAEKVQGIDQRRKKLLTEAVKIVPLFKTFLEWDRVPGVEQWWKKLGFMHGKSTTDLEVRQVHYYDNEDILLYSSGKYADYWREQFKQDWRAAAKKMFEQIKLVHGPAADDIPEPDYDSTLFKYWCNGSHKWRVGVDVHDAIPRICHGDSTNVFIVGDAYSSAQGWVNGCIETADLALSKISL